MLPENELLAGSGLVPEKSSQIQSPGGTWTRLEVSFQFRDLRCDSQEARAALYLPSGWQASVPLPLLHVAGYELTAGPGALLASHWLRRDIVIANPLTPEPGSLWPGENALARGINLDAALMHRVRALPVVDDEKVLVAGWSAGGAMTCLLAAETFPVAGIFPQLALMDVGWVASALAANDRFAADNPNRTAVAAVFAQMKQALGDDPASEPWLDHFPVSVLDEITCPVLGVWSTADGLVPIDHISGDHVRSGGVLVADATSVLGGPRPTVTELLGPHEHHVLPVPTGLPEIRPGSAIGPADWGWLELPAGEERWTVCITDEGPTLPWVDHLRFACLWTSEAFFDRCLSEPPGARQLTPAKLGRLMDRYAGIEARSHGLVHLDEPGAERADVLRGLRTFARRSDNRAHLTELYAQLPPESRVLGSPADLEELLGR